ncbi:MAG: nicotinamide riboside transporter PnuC, partial [Firmicutes bacterium]|nr:nicotinamide riboside transporter PnuC [Bacillota bacterium]
MAGVVKSLKELKWYEHLMAVIMILIAARAMVLAFGAGDEGGNPAWLAVLNFISAVCGVACIFFTAKAHIINFPFAILNTLSYAVYLLYWKIYGTFLLEILVYLPIEIVSLALWIRHRDETRKERTKARKLTIAQNIFTAMI